MSRSRTATALVAVAIMLATASAQAETSYNAVEQFSVQSNPNGPWSYRDTDLLPKKSRRFQQAAKLPSWSNTDRYPNSVLILRNKTGTATSVDDGDVIVPTDHLLMDGQANPATVRFEAPVAGSYTVKGDFVGLNTSEQPHDVIIDVNGTQMFIRTLSGYNMPRHFKLALTLEASDTVDFISKATTTPNYLGTGLKAKIIGP